MGVKSGINTLHDISTGENFHHISSLPIIVSVSRVIPVFVTIHA